MILDAQTEMATGVALDLEAVRPGPGKPIKMFALLDSDGDLAITHGTSAALAEGGLTALMTVACAGMTEFEIPSTALQFIAATFTGEVGVVMDVQTSK